MDGVVIHMSSNGAGAIIWCSDQGPLGLARREDLLSDADKPLAVGDFVHFDVIEDGEMRICAAVTRDPARSMPEVAELLRKSEPPSRSRSHLRLVHTTDSPRRHLAKSLACV